MIIGRAIMALPIIFVAVLNFDSPYYRSADSPILPYAVSLFRVREKEREGDFHSYIVSKFFAIVPCSLHAQ